MEENYEQEYRKVFIELLLVLKEKIAVIFISTLVTAIIGWGVATLLIPKKYEASVNMIVNTRIDVSREITNDNISSAQNLVDTYAIIIKSNTVLNQVIDDIGLDMTYEEIYEQVSINAINNTQVMKIAVKDNDPTIAKQIVETISRIAPDVVVSAVEAGSCKVVSQVYVDDKPVSPNVLKNTILAGFMGMLVCIAIIILRELQNDYITDEADVEKKLGSSVLGVIPNLTENKRNNMKKYIPKNRFVLYKGAPFRYVEAYKTLRTNVSFVSNANDARCILITSAIPDESKSTTAINLAITLAQNNHSVIVVECDLRRPIIQEYLKLETTTKGLSSVLAAGATMNECIIKVEGMGINIMPAGVIPPNPSELLNNERMKTMLDILKQRFDYVILDAPPVTVVTDATVVGGMADGALLIVRSEFAPAKVVRLAKKRLQSVGINVMGTVLTRVDASKTNLRSGYGYEEYGYGYSKSKNEK